MVENEREWPEGTTHTSEGYAYRVADSCVKYFDHGEWVLCDDAYNLDDWMEELTPVT